MIRPLSKKEFKEVVGTDYLSLVQFKTDWSGACQIMAPAYKELAKSFYPKACFYTLDIEKETGIDIEYGVMEIPTILFFRKGQIIDHITGLIPKNLMIAKLENAIATTIN